MKPKIQKELFGKKQTITPKHDEMLVKFSRKSTHLKVLLSQILCRHRLIQGELHKWESEKVLKSTNGYYLGSIDLYIGLKARETIEKKWNWYDLIIEFKPKITSFSETLRQINVYATYFPKCSDGKLLLCVVTYSDISKFKEIFGSQNINLIQLK